MGKFIGQFICYAVASVIAPLIPFAVLSAIPFVVFVLVGLISPLMWAAPILVLVHAAIKRNAGGMLGALCGLPLLFAYFEIDLALEAGRIEALDQRRILPSQQEHAVLVTEDSYFSLQEGAEGCSEVCLQILFDGRYVPAVKHSNSDVWRVFRLAHGQPCAESPRSSRYLELLGRRYTDVCISVSDDTPQGDALVIREHFSGKSHIRRELPHRSGVREYLERVDNQDRVLSRWVTAILEQSGPWTMFWGLRTRTIGVPFQDEEFYAAVLSIPMQEHLPRGNATVSAVLNELRPFFDDPEMAGSAMYAFENVARSSKDGDKAIARAFIEARTNELKASPNPDPSRVRWFESWVKRL